MLSTKETIEVTILHVVNPSSFWIRRNDRFDVEVIQEDLRNYCEQVRRAPKLNFQYNNGDLVVVRIKDGTYHRAEVDFVELETGLYKVDFLDICTPNELFSAEDLCPLPDEWSKLSRLAFLVGIYGVLPFDPSAHPIAALESWEKKTPAVREILSSENVLLYQHQVYIDDVSFGDIIFDSPDSKRSIRGILTACGYGVHSDHFEEDILQIRLTLKNFSEERFEEECIERPISSLSSTSSSSTRKVIRLSRPKPLIGSDDGSVKSSKLSAPRLKSIYQFLNGFYFGPGSNEEESDGISKDLLGIVIPKDIARESIEAMSASVSRAGSKTPESSRHFDKTKYFGRGSRSDHQRQTPDGNSSKEQENRVFHRSKHHDSVPSYQRAGSRTSFNRSVKGDESFAQSPSLGQRQVPKSSSSSEPENRGFHRAKHRDRGLSIQRSDSHTSDDNRSVEANKPFVLSPGPRQASRDQPTTLQDLEPVVKPIPTPKVSGFGRGKFIQRLLETSTFPVSSRCTDTTPSSFDQHFLGDGPLQSALVTEEGLLITTLNDSSVNLSKKCPVSSSTPILSFNTSSRNNANDLSAPSNKRRSIISSPSERSDYESDVSLPSYGNPHAVNSLSSKNRTNQLATNLGSHSSPCVTSADEPSFSPTKSNADSNPKPKREIAEFESVNSRFNEDNLSSSSSTRKSKISPHSFLANMMKKRQSSLTESSGLEENIPSILRTSSVSSDKSYSDPLDAGWSARLSNRSPKKISTPSSDDSSDAETGQKRAVNNLSSNQTVNEIVSLQAYDGRSVLAQGELSAHEDNILAEKTSSSVNSEVELNSSGHDSVKEPSFHKSDGFKTLSKHSKQFPTSHKDQQFPKPEEDFIARTKNISGILHGFTDIQPITTIHEVKFHPSLLKRMMEMGAKDLTRCQMYGFPVVTSGRNFVMVAPRNSGRTSTCSLSVASQLMYSEKYVHLRVGCGPRAVFLLTASKKVRELGIYFSQIKRDLSVLIAHGGGLENEIRESLTNGCDILVTTTRCWLRLLSYKTVTNFDRLCHLVIDHFETQLDLFTPEITTILKLVKNLNFNRKKNNIDPLVQVAVISERWSSELEELLIRNPQTALYQPIVGFTSFSEAAIYAGVKPNVRVITSDALRQRLKDEVLAHADKCGVIVCKNDAEVKELRIELTPIRKNLLVAHSGMHNYSLRDTRVEWHSSVERSKSDSELESPPLLLVSDPVLDDLYIQNAQWLFHYSIPDSRTYFNSRFATIKGLINDKIKDPQAAPPSCLVEICIMDSNHEQLPCLINLLQRLKMPLPTDLTDLLPALKMQRESNKSHAHFCKRLLKFGKCWRESYNCGAQHIISPLRDVSQFPVREGFVKIDILHVLDASHFSARILGFSSIGIPGDNFTLLDSDHLSIAFKMSSYFSSRANRVPHGEVQVGDMVAVEVDIDTLFRRARVTEIIERDAKNKPLKVQIFHVDHGLRENRKPTDLLALPKALHKYPDVAVDVYLSRLLPVDLDVSWGHAANHLVRCKVGLHEKFHFIGEIKLIVGKNIIVDNLKCYNYLPESETYVCQLNIRKLIFDKQLAVNNPEHLNILYDLCRKAGMDHPQDNPLTQSVVKKVSNTGLKPDWAFLNLEGFNEVELVVTESPTLFLVKLTKFLDCLTVLHKDLEAAVTNGECKPVLNSSRLEVNSYWIVLKKTTWNRVVVLNPPNNNTVEVLFLDFGDTDEVPINQLRSIPRRLIMQLPFQAIECSLVGVQPIDDEWSVAAYKYFDDLAQICPLYVKVCETRKHAKFTGGRHYSVVLFDTITVPNKDIIINQEMISKGLANASKTRHYLNSVFNLPKIEYEGSSTSEDEAVYDKPLDLEDILNTAFSKDTEKLPSEFGNFDELEFFSGGNGEDLVDSVFTSVTNVLRSFDLTNLTNRPKELEFKKTSDYNNTNGDRTVTCVPFTTRESENNARSSEQMNMGESTNPIRSESMPALRHLCLPRGTVEPYIHWRQNSQSVYLRILIFDLQSDDAGFEWSSSNLIFMALKEHRRYFFKIDLFGPINPDTIVFNLTGQYYEVKLEKLRKNFPWARLTSDDVKYLFIKFDPDHLKAPKVKRIRAVEWMYEKARHMNKCSGGANLKDEANIPDADIPRDYDSSDIESESDSE